MANQYVNKVIVNGQTKIDLTGDTVDEAHLLSGVTAHDRSGAPIEGSCTYDADTTDATAAASEILAGKTAYVAGAKVSGTMTNNGSDGGGTISAKAQQVTIPQGYHDGSGKVQIASSEQAKVIPGNIKAGVELLGVTGDYSGASITAQARNATPSFAQQTIIPESGFDYLSQVVIAPIPVTETDNAQGGVTVTVG